MADEITSGASMLAAGAVDGNFLTRLRDIEQRLSVLEGANMQAAALDEISSDMGDMRSGRFIAATEGWEPTEADFVGSFMSAEGEDFSATGGGTIHVGSARGGTISAGFNTDGDLIAGLGAMKINENGITFEVDADTSSYIRWMKNSGSAFVSYYSVSENTVTVMGQNTSGTITTYLTSAGIVPTLYLGAQTPGGPSRGGIIKVTPDLLQFYQYDSTLPSYPDMFGTITFSGGTITADKFVGSVDLSGTLTVDINGSVNGGTIGATSAVIGGAFTAGTITAQAQGGTPTAPASGYRTLYPKTDGWYDLNSGGTVSRLALASEIVATYPEWWQGWLGNWQAYDSSGNRLSWTYNSYAANKSGMDIYLLAAAAANGWYAILNVPLRAGTYTFYMMRFGTPDSGKFDLYVGSSKITATPYDCYEDPSHYNRKWDVTGITIAADGWYQFKILNAGKNGSSSDYTLHGSYMGIDRTA